MDINVRIIPVLLYEKNGLYKTVQFKRSSYVGDPINTVKIFNEKEADEIVLLDYHASLNGTKPDFANITEIASEAFMPMAYGGGIKTLDDAKRVFDCGFEKIVVNSILFDNGNLVAEVASIYGSQSVIAAIDVKKSIFGKYSVYSSSGTKNMKRSPLEWTKELEDKGVGEIFLNSIENDGTWNGYDLDLINNISNKISIPLIACGGAGSTSDFEKAIKAGASAVAAGSMFVYQKKGMGVLISFPTRD